MRPERLTMRLVDEIVPSLQVVVSVGKECAMVDCGESTPAVCGTVEDSKNIINRTASSTY